MYNARDAYLGTTVNTASPGRLLILLYDRLVLDLQRAVELQDSSDFVAASTQLLHAQDIILELQSSLRTDVWDGAVQLSSIYGWLHTELVRANVHRDVTVTRSCLDLVVPLADAWRQAALASVEH